MPIHVFCGHQDAGTALHLAAELREIAGDAFTFTHFDDGGDLLDKALAVRQQGEDLALVFCGLKLDTINGEETLHRIRQEPLLRGTRKILFDILNGGNAVDKLLQSGALQARLDPDFDGDRLRNLLRTQLTDYVIHTAPHRIDELHHLLDLRTLSTAFSTAKDNLERLSSRMSQVQSSVIGAPGLSDDKVEAAMIDEFDRLLNHPERRAYQPNEMIVREGDESGAIWIILSGRVKLFRTMDDGKDVIFHSESAGRIVGLMSLSLQNPVFFSCVAATEVRALVLNRDQVREAIEQSPTLSGYLITVIIRSMARRNRRASQLLLQVHHLNNRLERQRDDLESALNDLQAAQTQLVESEKMATLGSLAAGMAHELNNPVAALQHAARYLLEDVRALLESSPQLSPAAAALKLGRQREPLSTRDERRLKRELESELETGSASRLLGAGVRSVDDFHSLLDLAPASDRGELVEQIEHGGQIGTALRNIENCGQRIAALVRSLKVYARADPDWSDDIDLHATIEDVLLILANKLHDVEITKDYADLPPLRCIPSQLQQVWTNLIQNAAQAMDKGGILTLRSSRNADGPVRIEIEDNGSGIPAEAQPHVFSPRFTTKSGRVEFGLGLGLPICKTIIERHGGNIRFDSQPGRTVFIVELPVKPPDPDPKT